MNKWRVELCRHLVGAKDCGLFVVRDPAGNPRSRHRKIEDATSYADRWARRGGSMPLRVKVSIAGADR